jgi:hypothetical protein
MTMPNRKADDKNVELLKLIGQLRDQIDVHRIIGLNAVALRDVTAGGGVFGHLQKTAHESLAIYICKIFEASSRNDLNSIPGIIDSIPDASLSTAQKRDFAAFGERYGNHVAPTHARSYLKGTFGLFCGIHSDPLSRLKEFRDTIGAHSQSKVAITFLPSHAEFETLFGFAYDFYRLVSRSINGVGPAPIPRIVGRSFVKLLEALGVKDVRFDFDDTSESPNRPMTQPSDDD